MRPILTGIETEYGLSIEGHGAERQIDDALELLDAFEGVGFRGWDNSFETPRNDLRGFKLERLTPDAVDAQFDANRAAPTSKGDWILANGARFYNDHGHPEYSTPEGWSCAEVARQDALGEGIVQAAAKSLSAKIGKPVAIYKNNTDFHGASYGTHENYLVPRSLGFERLYRAVTPMLVARTLLCGAGKVGSEAGPPCDYQLSQRADFMLDSANAETLSRRPVFNTRDEPHADAARWIRLHVISGDANRIQSCTSRKVALIQLAIALEEAGVDLGLRLADPVRAFQAVSRHPESTLALEGGGSCTATEIIERTLDGSEVLELTPELVAVVGQCRRLLAAFRDDPKEFATHVDWAAKKLLLEEFVESEGVPWDAEALASYDLAYHEVNSDEGLFEALVEANRVDSPLAPSLAAGRGAIPGPCERTRAWARSLAIEKFHSHLVTASWRSVVLNWEGEAIEVELPPDRVYPVELGETENVGMFIALLRGTA